MKFLPLFKEKIWGGRNIEKIFGKTLPPHQKIGESWEICDRGEDQSIVQNGPYRGKTLHELMLALGKILMGDSFSEIPQRFPLLFKVIDAQDDLSLQVHPDDTYAARNEKGDTGKTEMWYVIHSKEGAKIFCGLKKGVDLAQLKKNLGSKNIEDLLEVFNPKAGDVFFLPSGTVHALGKGNAVIEIQENSDVTYRLSDWGRVGDDGKPRPLHIEKGMEVISLKKEYKRISAQERKNEMLIECPYFSVREMCFNHTQANEVKPQTFQVWIILEGNGSLNNEPFGKGDFFLIPAHLENVQIIPQNPTRLLKVWPGTILKR